MLSANITSKDYPEKSYGLSKVAIFIIEYTDAYCGLIKGGTER